MKVPFFNYSKLYEDDKTLLDPVVKDCMSRGAFIMQDDLAQLEVELADYLEAKYVIGVADGTNAIFISLIALGLKSGGEVIMPSHTFCATASAVKHAGLQPVLADCREDHLLNPNDIEHRINKNTVAIMPVQLNGRTCEMDRISEIAKKYNLPIIEDSCQALGSKFKNKFAGTFGEFGVLSFYPAKTLGCFGDGGAIITSNDELYNQIIQLRDHGRNSVGMVTKWGFNSRLDNLQAAILSAKFKKYDEIVSKRRHLASLYIKYLSEVDEISLPPMDDDGHFDVFQNFEIRAHKRDELIAYLSNNDVGTMKQWGGFCLHHFKDLGLNSDVPYCEEMAKSFMMLPLNTTLSDDDVEFVSTKIIDFYKL